MSDLIPTYIRDDDADDDSQTYTHAYVLPCEGNPPDHPSMCVRVSFQFCVCSFRRHVRCVRVCVFSSSWPVLGWLGCIRGFYATLSRLHAERFAWRICVFIIVHMCAHVSHARVRVCMCRLRACSISNTNNVRDKREEENKHRTRKSAKQQRQYKYHRSDGKRDGKPDFNPETTTRRTLQKTQRHTTTISAEHSGAGCVHCARAHQNLYFCDHLIECVVRWCAAIHIFRPSFGWVIMSPPPPSSSSPAYFRKAPKR